VCPWWLGYLLACPLRRLVQNPERLLAPHLRPGMTVLDIGPGMGFFTLPAARLVGERGRVVAVDLQPRMITSLTRRAQHAGLADRVDARICAPGDLGVSDLAGQVDLALALAMLHEVPDPDRLLAEVGRVLKPAGRLVLAEPRGHVSDGDFETALDCARRAGLDLVDRPRVPLSHAAVLQRPA